MPPTAASPSIRAETVRGWLFDGAERAFILLLIGFFLVRFAEAPSYHLHDVLLVMAELMVGLFVLIRRRGPPVLHVGAWAAALLGTAAPLLVVPGGATLLAPGVGSVLMTVGFLVNLSAKLFLRRSFGLVAANRGVKTEGPYRLVRHPMYAGYLMTHVGFLVAAFTAWNLAIYLICWLAMVVRIRAEEEVLMRDPAYAAYARKVSARLIPGLW